MKNIFFKVLALMIMLVMAFTFVSCGDDDGNGEDTATDTELPYETLDDEGWSPIWRP